MKNTLNKIKSSLYCRMIIPAFLLFAVTFFTDEMMFHLYEYGIFSFIYMVIMNVLPLYFVIFLFYHLVHKVWVGTSIVALLFGVLHTINCYKVIYRAEPFKISDITTTKEAANIIQNYDIELQPLIVVMWVLFITICVLTYYFENKRGFFKRKERENKKKDNYLRITAVIVGIISSVLVYNFVYQSLAIMSPLTTTKEYLDVVKKQKRVGFAAYVLSTRYINEFVAPENYNQDEVVDILKQYESETKETKDIKYPNVIAIMSESFFDPQSGSNVRFHPGKEPLVNYNRIKALPTTRYGEILVPGMGGGTADTEYEFLTGSNSSVINTAMVPIFKSYLKEDVFSIAHYFKELGYETHGIHPGFRWFYNRGEVYGWLGFDDFLTVESLPFNVPRTNTYVNDSVTTQLIQDSYDAYLEKNPEGGYFNFTVTIQNHGPYSDDENEPVLVRKDIEDDGLYNVMNNYMRGIADSDIMLKNMEDYINSKSDPVVVVFFGDHLPYFDEDREGLKLLGFDVESDFEGVARRFTTPYIIFGNKAFFDWEKENGFESHTGDSGLISASFLAGEMFEYAHIEKPALFKFIDDLKGHIQAVRYKYFYLHNGNIDANIDAKATEMLEKYRKLVFYFNTEWKNQR